VVNGRDHVVDFAELIEQLHTHFAPLNRAWAVLAQGDPTDINIGWTSTTGPIWFDYDTGGLNALPGEFACFLLYQRLHGAWLTGHYNPAAFRDHRAACAQACLSQPRVSVTVDRTTATIDYRHAASPARQYVMHRYLDEIVRPVAAAIRVGDLMSWLRPYLAMRLLAVYDLDHPRTTRHRAVPGPARRSA
jgi:hypothetical protein